MIIEVLVCKPDGTQALESREVPDDFFESVTPLDSATDKQET